MGEMFMETIKGSMVDNLMKNFKKDQHNYMIKAVGLVDNILTEGQISVRATSGAKLIFKNQSTGEEYVVKELGYQIK